MCKCRKPEHIKTEQPILNKNRNIKKKKKTMWTTWDEIDKSKTEDDSDEERESLSCFYGNIQLCNIVKF